MKQNGYKRPIIIALRALYAASIILSSGASLAGEVRFFSELSDIPLMPGLYELTEKTVIFDKPEGRIVESSAVSETENTINIKEFYDSSLPQLGWIRQGDSYVRGDEILNLAVGAESGVSVLKITVSPR